STPEMARAEMPAMAFLFMILLLVWVSCGLGQELGHAPHRRAARAGHTSLKPVHFDRGMWHGDRRRRAARLLRRLRAQLSSEPCSVNSSLRNQPFRSEEARSGLAYGFLKPQEQHDLGQGRFMTSPR